MNAPVNFELAKLLKEKGFDDPCRLYGYLDRKRVGMSYDPETCVKIPTISDVVMWIYKKYGIWLWVIMELGYRKTFCWVFTGEHTSSNYKSGFESPEKAYEAGIKFIVEAI